MTECKSRVREFIVLYAGLKPSLVATFGQAALPMKVLIGGERQ